MAVDTPDVSRYGHITTYPGDADAVTLQVPFEDEVPEHVVLYDGPCLWSEMTGI